MPHAPCIHCGEVIEAGDKFCEHCGKAQIRANVPPATIATPPPIAPPAAQPAPEKGSGRSCGCILALILIIGLAASIGMCKQRQQKQKPPPPPANNGIAIPVPYGHDGVLTPPRASPGKY